MRPLYAMFTLAVVAVVAMVAMVAMTAVVTGGTVATAQDPLPEVDRFGPQVGETVPDFSLVDQLGDARTLSSLMGPNGLMLVFSRSADW